MAISIHEAYRLKVEGVPNKKVVELYDKSPAQLNKDLKKAGYVYSDTLRGWTNPNNIGEEVTTEETTVQKEVASAVEDVQKEKSPVEVRKEFEDAFETPADINVQNDTYIDPTPEPAFTPEEILALKELLKKQGELNVNKNSHDVKTELNEKVKALSLITERKRKTVILEESISDKLDSFSAEEKIMKSDILHIALAEFFEKYSK